MAGRLDGGAGVAFVKGKRAQSDTDDESWRADTVTPTLTGFDVGDTRATVAIVAPTIGSIGSGSGGPDDNDARSGHVVIAPSGTADDPLLPLGPDSHRYRAIGNGVAAPCAEWIGRRLAAYLARRIVEGA
jgi:site-specific DNA-cytosine methylase